LERAEGGDLIAQRELFRDMEERDGHVFAEISKRKRAIIKLSWDVLPPRNPSKEEEQDTAYVKELLLDIYGLPLRIGKYPLNARDTEKATLWRAVAGIGHNAGARDLADSAARQRQRGCAV
jgi:phage gp29-like protein